MQLTCFGAGGAQGLASRRTNADLSGIHGVEGATFSLELGAGREEGYKRSSGGRNV